MTVPQPPPELTRENRYTPAVTLLFANNAGNIIVCKCRSCGAILQDTDKDKDLHERMHPRVNCERVPVCFVWHEAGHPWEDQFING